MASGKKSKKPRKSKGPPAYPQIGPKGERPAPPDVKARRKTKLDVARDRWRAAIARTRSSRAEIDAFIKGVRPDKGRVIVKGKPRRAVEVDEVDIPPPRAPMAPAVDYDRNIIHQVAAQQPRPKKMKLVERETAARQDSDGRVGLSHCTLCGRGGHNRRRHAREPKCVHALPWSLCQSCLRTASTVSGPPAPAPISP